MDETNGILIYCTMRLSCSKKTFIKHVRCIIQNKKERYLPKEILPWIPCFMKISKHLQQHKLIHKKTSKNNFVYSDPQNFVEKA